MRQENSTVIQVDMEGRIIFKPLGVKDLKSMTHKRKQQQTGLVNVIILSKYMTRRSGAYAEEHSSQKY